MSTRAVVDANHKIPAAVYHRLDGQLGSVVVKGTLRKESAVPECGVLLSSAVNGRVGSAGPSRGIFEHHAALGAASHDSYSGSEDVVALWPVLAPPAAGTGARRKLVDVGLREDGQSHLGVLFLAHLFRGSLQMRQVYCVDGM